jgi:hypothetical protein
MGIDYGKKILTVLVDWYENSPAYKRGQIPSRRRIMRMHDDDNLTDFPAYNIEDHLIRKEVNQAVLNLAKEGIIGYKWMQGQKDHILSRLWLNTGEIGRAYAQLKRQPKGDAVKALLLRLTRLLGQTTTNWARHWLEDNIILISQKRSIGTSMPSSALEQDDLLKAVACLSDNAEIEMLERVFSMRCFGDTKHFERSVRNRLVRILKKYLAQEECTDEEALRLAGIVFYPEQFSFAGPLSIFLPRGKLDFSTLPFGGTLTIEDIKQGQILLGPNTRRILSIENRANYVDYIHKSQESGELVVYHGGQFSPAKRVFLLAIVSSMTDSCDFFHWGDIDYGGFLMLARLRREILPEVQPWRMTQEELVRYAKLTTGFTDTYRKRLSTLLDIAELSDCFQCIKFMLKEGIRLEQEAMLT